MAAQMPSPSDGPGDRYTKAGASGLCVDVHGLRVSLSPGKGGQRPKTWKDVWDGVQQHLKRICIDVPGVLADTFDSGRAVVQGIGNAAKGAASLPSEVMKRIRRGRGRAMAREDQLSAATTDGASPSARDGHMDECFKTIVAKVTARGGIVEIHKAPTGDCVIILVRPEQRSVALALGEREARQAAAPQFEDEEFLRD
jgi:hypothetical protein